MTDLQDLLRSSTQALQAHGARFALVGGLAVSVRTEPRFTRDIDLVVSVASDAEAERLVANLVPPHQLVATIEHESLERLAAVRLAHREGPGAVLDLLFASSGIEPEIVFCGGHARGRAWRPRTRGDHRPSHRAESCSPGHRTGPRTTSTCVP